MNARQANSSGPVTASAPRFTQADRAFAITTPLGEDKLLLTGFTGYESISQLFHFQLHLLAEAETEIRFDRIVGQNVSVRMQLTGGNHRFFGGLIRRFTQGERDETFMHYYAELVPDLWLLTKKVRSRIFQRLSAPEILHKVLSGMNVAYELSGTYYPRDYCVQYRESDFDFVSRLMEEEGIYYFFKHTEANHELVVSDASNRHPAIPEPSSVIYGSISSGVRDDMRVVTWEKTQELRAGEYTLWDHCFELPGNHLEATEKTSTSLNAGKVVHKLSLPANQQLEIYDYPGGYAQRFDGIDASGAPRPQDLHNVFEDRQRTVRIRMEQEEAASLEITGTSDCGHFTAGHKFSLQRHLDADGQYLLTRVEHDAQLGGYRSSEAPVFSYENRFTCIPVALPYRPQRVTRRPVIAGVQTATVVGPPGEELFCDKYGRVKVQFHWDREGKKDPGSSCWLRVAQPWAGNGWGAFFWPRVGHEVVVTFEEGDPDQPLIIGSVYNAQNMPPFELPVNNQLSGFKSASVRGKVQKNFNGILFNDQKGHEHLAFHSERHMSFNSEYDKSFHAGRNKHEAVSNVSTFVVGSLPGGGGSGGGDNYEALGTVDSQGIPGLNSVVVYGENLQVAVGLNHQLAIGSNLQLCINPTAVAEAFGSELKDEKGGGTSSVGSSVGVPDAVKALFGSGPGGNMQLTLGTSANIVLGKSFSLNLGETIQPKAGKHLGTKIACGALGLVTILFSILYGIKGLMSTNAKRVTLVVTFEAAVQACLMAIMLIEAAYTKAQDDWVGGILSLFDPALASGHLQISTCPTVDKVANTAIKIAEVGLETAAAIAIATVPPVLAAKEEKLDD